MNFLKFIFLLVGSNVPITKQQLEDIEIEANEWQKSLGTFDEARRPANPKELYLWANRQWYIKLGLCLLYIPINRALKKASYEDVDIDDIFDEDE